MSARLMNTIIRGINTQTFPAAIQLLSTQNEQQLIKIIVPKIPFEMPVVHYVDQSIVILDKKHTKK